MSLSAARIALTDDGPVMAEGRPLPLAALLVGQTAEEAAALLPRLFNLCGMAQGLAARLSMGLPAAPADATVEVVRDHVARAAVTLRAAFGLAPLRLPADPLALLGPARDLPRDLSGLAAWMAGEAPAAALAREIEARFPAGVAVTAALPAADDPLAAGAFETSPAGRQADHPLLRAVEARQGRGPLWRYLGQLADLRAAATGGLPAPACHAGLAVVQASRGAYALRLRLTSGRVTGIARRTPTDHMLAPGGALMQALATLPRDLWRLAPQVVALHDPCLPVTVTVTATEAADA